MEQQKSKSPPAAPPLRSALAGARWPGLASTANAQIHVLERSLAQTQWWSADRLLRHQLLQIEHLIDHAVRHAPFYRDRLAPLAKLAPGTLSLKQFRQIPILERAEVQAAGEALNAAVTPPGHEPIKTITTSGSTGAPIVTRGTHLTGLFVAATNLRYQLWHDFAPDAVFCAIRAVPNGQAQPPDGARRPNWMPGRQSGPALVLDAASPLSAQIDWLRRADPDYLLSYPSNLLALTQSCRAEGITLPRLRAVASFGECPPDGLRAACHDAWGVTLSDIYSAQEVGTIAAQCPTGEHYHIQAEDVLVELLDEAGAPVKTGQTGRVVVTSLHNYATPLIRYAIGDYAERGAACRCGRGLPVLLRIQGRARNMLRLPNGDVLWPRFNSDSLRAAAPIRQFQLVQKTPEDIEVALVTERPLSDAEEQALREMMRARLKYPYALPFTYVDEIPRSKSGKYEDFKSEITD